MQLKKKLAVARNTIVVSAVTAAMLVGAAPAFADNGLHLGASAHAEHDLGAKGLFKAAGKALGKVKIEKHDSDHEHESASGTRVTRATNSASATAAVACRTNATHAHKAAINAAADTRDAEMKAARNAFLFATDAARAKYKIELSVSATATASASGTIQVNAALQLRKDARKHYHDAVKAAQVAFNNSKRKVMSDYRTAVQSANSTFKNTRLACRASVN